MIYGRVMSEFLRAAYYNIRTGYYALMRYYDNVLLNGHVPVSRTIRVLMYIKLVIVDSVVWTNFYA